MNVRLQAAVVCAFLSAGLQAGTITAGADANFSTPYLQAGATVSCNQLLPNSGALTTAQCGQSSYPTALTTNPGFTETYLVSTTGSATYGSISATAELSGTGTGTNVEPGTEYAGFYATVDDNSVLLKVPGGGSNQQYTVYYTVTVTGTQSSATPQVGNLGGGSSATLEYGFSSAGDYSLAFGTSTYTIHDVVRNNQTFNLTLGLSFTDSLGGVGADAAYSFDNLESWSAQITNVYVVQGNLFNPGPQVPFGGWSLQGSNGTPYSHFSSLYTPEPQSAALLLAGLAVFGLRLRRRA